MECNIVQYHPQQHDYQRKETGIEQEEFGRFDT